MARSQEKDKKASTIAATLVHSATAGLPATRREVQTRGNMRVQLHATVPIAVPTQIPTERAIQPKLRPPQANTPQVAKTSARCVVPAATVTPGQEWLARIAVANRAATASRVRQAKPKGERWS